MLVIRLQRTGRKGHAMFRLVVQDSRRTPTSGKVVAWLGSYDPHNKTIIVDKEKASFYLEHGAQPSGRIAGLLKNEGVKLPDWVQIASDKKRDVKNADKRRSTRPPEPKAEEVSAEEPATETPATEVEEPAATEEAEAPATETEEVKPEEAVEESAPETESTPEAVPEEAKSEETAAEVPATETPAEAETKKA
jgi:small subunit ribosomal protein S16